MSTGLMNVAGRESECRRLERLLADREAWPAVLALEGAPGIGKSTLWRDAVAMARGLDIQVIVTAPSEPDRGLAFAGLGDLFSELPADVVAELPAVQRAAVSAAMFEGDGERGVDPQVLPRAVLGVIRGLAARAPLVVAIDDEQWLDRSSARVLAFALTRLRTEPVAVLIARRPDSESVLWPELSRRFAGDALVVVGPLEQGALQRLVVERVGRPLGRTQLRRVCELSGGNPLYALAIADELVGTRSGDFGGSELPLPSSLTEAMTRRLERLDARAADPLLVASAVARPNLALLQSVLPDFVLGDLDAAQRTGVVEFEGDRVRFSHPLLAATHYSNADPARRRELHRLLADALDDEVEGAYHLARGAEAPDREIAARIELAAQAAARRGAPATGAELLEQAVRLTPFDAAEARRSRVISAAELHTTGGAETRARELLEAVLPDLPRGPTRARALLQLAWIISDDHAAIQPLLEEALNDAGDHHRLRGQIEMALASDSEGRVDFAAALVHAQAALEAAEHANDPGFLAEATAAYEYQTFVSGGSPDPDAMRRSIEFEYSLQNQSEFTFVWPSAHIARVLLWSDDYSQARPALERVIRLVKERGDVFATSFYEIHLAFLDFHAGDREAGERHRVASSELASRDDDDMAVIQMYFEALFAAGRGELEFAHAHAVSTLEMAERIGHFLFVLLTAAVVGCLEFWTGKPAAAHDRLRSFRQKFLSSGFGFVGSLSLPLWSVDIEALIALGRLDEAQSVLDDLLARAGRSGNANAVAIAERCRGLLLAARGEVAAGIDAMNAALVAHEQRRLEPEVARTLLELGVLQRRAKQKSAAKRSLEEALAIFEPMGAAMWVERARDELGRVGLRRAVVSDGLTPAQERVAELVAAGMSNREIASTLYMSVRSVESHLTKVYREYGVKSRAQLVASMAASADDQPAAQSST